VQDWSPLTFAALIVWVAGIAWSVATACLATIQPLRRRTTRRSVASPPISIIVPVASPAPILEAATAALLRLDYRDYEVVLCAASNDAAGIELIERVACTSPRLRTCRGILRSGVNPKSILLAAGVAAARHELLLLSDDNVLSQPRRLQTNLAHRDAGFALVSTAVFGVEATTFWSEVDGAFMNGHFARIQRAGDAVGQSFAAGKTMFLSRAHLARAGGLIAAGQTLCEDGALQRQLTAAGLRTVVSDERLVQPLGARQRLDVWHRHLRWAGCRRRFAPALFLSELLLAAPVTAIAGGLAAPRLGLDSLGVSAASLMLMLTAEWIFLWLAGCPTGPRYCAAWMVRELMSLPMWFSALFQRTAMWRERKQLMGRSLS
jgi:ceramide glucosyltransferase